MQGSIRASSRCSIPPVYLLRDFRNTIILPCPWTIQPPTADATSPLHGIRAIIRPIRGISVSHFPRREFLKNGLAAGAFAVTGSVPLSAARQTATDWVTLGKSGVTVTRLAFGTGSFSGRVQSDLGQDGFTRLVRYAYDSGIRFFETAESYHEMHRMLGAALKGIPRDSYRLMSKVTTHAGVNPQDKFAEFRTLANTEYF